MGLKIAGFAVLGLAVVAAILLARLSPLSHRWVVRALSQHYRCKVELRTFQVHLFPHIRVTGGGLVFQERGRPGLPPLASVKQFSMQASWLDLFRHPRRVGNVYLEGLILNVPPREHKPEANRGNQTRYRLPPIYFSDVDADGTTLNIFSSNPQKPPRAFAISGLRLQSVGVGKAMSFEATLTNPKPVGQIHTTGSFGPWDPNDPSSTAVSGRYAFRNADLSTIRGIAGILSSDGQFEGTLGQINVRGKTDTPDFSLGIGGNTEPLKTEFICVVDGVTGDTLLRPVTAELAHSLIVARGGVLRTTGLKGRTIMLDVTADHARIEDLVRLAIKSSTPPVTGAVNIKTKFDLSPGNKDIIRRLKLDGNFTIRSAQFTNLNVEEKITSLSHKATPGPDMPGNVVFNMKGHFRLNHGVMTFSALSFDVPGASVSLQGSYGLASEEVDFHGMLRLEARLSQMTTGIKSFLLKPIDPLFGGRGAGTVLPIKVTGTREHPLFGLDKHRLLKRFKL